jgi:hypothetical protein
MNRFSPSDAALEGFRVTRENPRTFAWWAGASFLVSVAGAIITVNMPADVRHALETLGAEETPDGKTLLDAFITASPLFLMGLALGSIMAAAVYRVIFRHEDSRFGYLRLGLDELRLMLLTVVFYFLSVFLVAAAVFGAVILAAIGSFAGSGAAYIAGLGGLIFLLGLALFILVRLSLALPATFAEKRLRFWESWVLTRGSFWPLLGAYLLATICMIVVGALALILFCAIAGAILLMTGGQLSDIAAILHPDETSIRAYLQPGVIAYMIVGSIFSALSNAVIAAPGAVVYRGLHDHPGGAFRVHESG